MSEEWETNYDRNKWRTNDANGKVDGLQWCANTMHEMQVWFLKEWFDRNKKMHGVDAVAKAQKECDRAIRKVRWSCDLKDKVMPSYCDAFYDAVEEHCDNVTTNQL